MKGAERQRGEAGDIVMVVGAFTLVAVASAVIAWKCSREFALLREAGLPRETRCVLIDGRLAAVYVEGGEVRARWIERAVK